MIQRLVSFAIAAIVFPFGLLYHMNKSLYWFTIGYMQGLVKILKGTF